MPAWLGPAIQGGAALAGLTGSRKKEKGVQKQGIENFGFLLQQLGPALEAYIASTYGAHALQGAQVGQQLQAGLGRVGAGTGGLGSVGRAIGRAYGGTQGSIAAGQARYQGMSDIAGKAVGWATGAGPAQPSAPNPFQTFITNLGQWLLTQQGGQAAGGVQGVQPSPLGMTPGMQFRGGATGGPGLTIPKNFTSVVRK